ncbi:MAG: hypothetical protein Q7J31_14580 [Syntrophales bacterium]|nr:hypothetical protein [Syntrophales bacterium]
MDSGEKNDYPKSLTSIGYGKRICVRFTILFEEWATIISILFRFWVFIPLLVSISAIYYAYSESANKSYSLFLNILATVSAGVASAFLFDSIKEIMGNTIIIKKGASAVRNLSQARQNIKNIVDRIKESASLDEIKNLLVRLEKDVANATQEWNDILPGVDNIEVVYSLLYEKEKDLDTANQRNKELKEGLKEKLSESAKGTEAKESLHQELEINKRKIEDLKKEISRLQYSTSMVASATGATGTSGSFGTTGPGYWEKRLKDALFQKCKECGNDYIHIGLMDGGLCDKCIAKQFFT